MYNYVKYVYSKIKVNSLIVIGIFTNFADCMDLFRDEITQIAPFLLWNYLTPPQKKVRLALSEVIN